MESPLFIWENKMIITEAIAAGIGYVAGAFTPSVLRKIKAAVTKEATTIKADIKAEIAKIEKKL